MEDGTIQYETRNEEGVSLEMLNITEKQRFMDGEKVLQQSKCKKYFIKMHLNPLLAYSYHLGSSFKWNLVAKRSSRS